MNEPDDYLLDPKAAPDPAVQALERALSPLAWQPVPMRETPAPVRARPRPVWPWLLAAVLCIGAGVFLFASVGDVLQPASPARVFVAKTATLRIPLGDLAEITLRPGSELEFAHWRADEVLFALRRGSLEARVAPPPKVQAGFFRMDTPHGRLIDQGCRYELVLHDEGRAHVLVTEGAVTFTAGERTVFVPAGAFTDVTPAGAQTPMFAAAAADLREAVRAFDAALAKQASLDERRVTLKQVLAAARLPRDSLVLWHLLRDPEPEFRTVAEAHLLDLTGSPDGGQTKRGSFDPEEWLPYLRLSAWQPGG